MKTCTMVAIALVMMVGPAVQAESFYPISSVTSDTAGNDYFPASRLIQGPGVGFDASSPHNRTSGLTWVTTQSGGDYFSPAPPTPSPRLVFDLGSDVTLSEISVWGYADSNANGVKDFSLQFATSAEGTGGFGTSIAFNPTYIAAKAQTPRQSFDFVQNVDARYVELTPLDNYYGSGPGGDRVGIGEIAFQVPTPGTVTAADLDYGISGKNNNSFNFDFSTQPVWTAGSQRSDNGSADAGNRRAGRVFVDFQLDADIIAAAAREGATASLTFEVDSIGSGVAGTPYIDGLDLRYLGLNASDRSAATLWNTGGVGGTDQADILVTAGPTGSHTITLTNASILSQIAGATPGQYVAFGMSNSIGITGDPVGNSTAETYGFQMSQATGNYALTVSGPIPEPMTMLAVGLAVAGLGGYIRKRRRA